MEKNKKCKNVLFFFKKIKIKVKMTKRRMLQEKKFGERFKTRHTIKRNHKYTMQILTFLLPKKKKGGGNKKKKNT